MLGDLRAAIYSSWFYKDDYIWCTYSTAGKESQHALWVECHNILQLSRKHHYSISSYSLIHTTRLETCVPAQLYQMSAITWYCIVYIDPTCWEKNTTWKTLAQSHIFLFQLILFPFILYFSLFKIPQDGPLNVSAFWSFCLLVSDSNMYPLSSSLSHYKVS